LVKNTIRKRVRRKAAPKRADGESIYHQDGKRKPRRNEGGKSHQPSVYGKFDDASRHVFLDHYRRTAVLYKSAHAANLSTQTIRNYILKDSEFAYQVKQAKEMYMELILQEVHRRGIEGIDAPIVYRGKVVGTIKKYSDRMLAVLAKHYDPEYRQRYDVTSTNKSTNVNVDVPADRIDLTKLTDEQLEGLEILRRSGDE